MAHLIVASNKCVSVFLVCLVDLNTRDKKLSNDLIEVHMANVSLNLGSFQFHHSRI